MSLALGAGGNHLRSEAESGSYILLVQLGPSHVSVASGYVPVAVSTSGAAWVRSLPYLDIFAP
jgi:hypothetical protein